MDEIVHLLGHSDTASGSDEKIDPTSANKFSATEASVLQVLEPYPIHFDDLVRKLLMPPSDLAAVLLRLELTNKVQQDPGKFFYLK